MMAASAGKLPGARTGRWGASEIGSSPARFWPAENMAGRFAATVVPLRLISAAGEEILVLNSRRTLSRRRRSVRKQERGLEASKRLLSPRAAVVLMSGHCLELGCD